MATREKPTPVELTERMNQQIGEFYAAKIALDEANRRFEEARGNVYELFATRGHKGVQPFIFNNGWQLKITNVFNYTLAANVEEGLDRLEELGESAKQIADNVVQWKPKLNVSLYSQLPAKEAAIISEYVDVRTGTPKVELIEPKTKR